MSITNRRRGGGRRPIPRTIGGVSVEAQTRRLSLALCRAVQDRLAEGAITLPEVAKAMQSSPHLIARYLSEPERLVSLRHVSALALAAGVSLRLEVVA